MRMLHERALKIVRYTSEATGVTVEDILSKDMNRHVVKARNMAMWIMRIDLDMTFREIATLMNRDFSGVRDSIYRLTENREHLQEANAIRQQIGVP